MTNVDLTGPRYNIEILDSPACAMPEYADYRRTFHLVTGAYALQCKDSAEEITESPSYWNEQWARIVRVPVIPFYDTEGSHPRAVGRPAWAGGTWIGRCGSAIWVRDTDRRYQDAYRTLRALDDSVHYIQDHNAPLANHDVGTTQAWWINGVSERHPSQDGFWIECEGKHRHDGPCTALDRAWDWHDYAPYAYTSPQLALF